MTGTVISVLDSLYVGVFGILVVFVVLAGLGLILRLQTAAVAKATGRKAAGNPASPAQPAPSAGEEHPDELKLIHVDEKTAAILMAIVADEMQAAPEELRFQSIKALDEQK